MSIKTYKLLWSPIIKSAAELNSMMFAGALQTNFDEWGSYLSKSGNTHIENSLELLDVKTSIKHQKQK